jgi:hypothetical protein
MGVSGTLTVSARLNYTGVLDLSTVSQPLAYQVAQAFATGTGANQATKLFTDTRTLAASTAEDLDLAGVLVDAFGATLTFASVRGLIIAAAPTNVNNVIVGNAASNGFISWVGGATHTITVRPGGVFALLTPDAAGYAVTAATADLLHVANGGAGTSVNYDVVILGT